MFFYNYIYTSKKNPTAARRFFYGYTDIRDLLSTEAVEYPWRTAGSAVKE